MIFVKLTNGFGNNLFQYIAARLLAEYHHSKLILIPPYKDYYGILELKKMGLKFDISHRDIDLSNILLITDKTYNSTFSPYYSNTPLLLDGYFEDYTYYFDYINIIKKWFPIFNKRIEKDLVVHIRLGDRLFYPSNFNSNGLPIFNPKKIINAIERFEFSQLYIVTDMPVWRKVPIEEFLEFEYHIPIDYNNSVNPNVALEYFNSVISLFEEYQPIVQNKGLHSDFSFIRSFQNILFQHSTFAWWAAVLSDANKIGVYGPWRPNKKEFNKNLSNIPIKGWFLWD